MKILNPRTVAPPGGPYVHGLLVDPGKTWLFVSGQVGIRADGSFAEGLVEQTRVIWTKLTDILNEGGMGVGNIVKMTSYLTSTAFTDEYRRMRFEFLGDCRPTSTALVVAGLAYPELLVEVDVIAAK